MYTDFIAPICWPRRSRPLNLLIVATKAPWPPIDGGRLLLLRTLEGLAVEGLRPTLVAPVDPTRFAVDDVAAALSSYCEPHLVAHRPRSRVATIASSLVRRLPLSIARHSPAAVRDTVARLVARQPFDV